MEKIRAACKLRQMHDHLEGKYDKYGTSFEVHLLFEFAGLLVIIISSCLE